MSVQEPPSGFCGRGGSGMKLPLRRAGDPHGHAFPISSSSSSCSSSSCMGESSPESLRSLSSLSGGRTESPVGGTDVVLSEWTPEDGRQACDEGEEEESYGRTAAKFSESNSASIYLDAKSGEYLRNTWKDLTLNTDSRSHGNCGHLRGSGRGRSSSDSDATEIPADEDDDDDEEEALFVSVSSELFVRGDGRTLSHVNPMTELHAEEEAAKSEGSRGEPKVSFCPDPPSDDLSEALETSYSSPLYFDSAQDAATPSSPPPERPERPSGRSKTAQAEVKRKGPPSTKKAPEVDLKSIKAKTGSSGSANQAKPSPAHNKRGFPRKEWCSVGKTPLTCPVKVAMVLRPMGRKSSNKAQLMDRTGAIAATPSDSAGVNPNTPKRAVRDVPDRPADISGEDPGESSEEGSEKAGSPEKTAPPRPGPRARQQEGGGRGDRGTAPPSGTGTGPPGPAEGGSGSPPQGEQSQTQRSPAVNQQPLRRTLSPPGSSAPQRPPVSRSRASAAGLKPPTTAKAAISQTAARAPPAGGPLQTKRSAPFQRSGSARFSRLGAAVDRNQAREAARPPNGSSQICPSAEGNQQNQQNRQNQQNQPLELVSDVTNGNSSGSAILPAADPPSPTGPAVSGFRTRTGPRSNTKTASRLQNASRPAVGGAADKQNQNKETEGKNQAVVQLRRLLLQGNRRVEALATVIQHLFSAREEALKQKTELSAQLSGLREELAASAQSCQRLQREKEEARLSFEESLRRQQEQHREELQQLEDRLKTFYQAEWDRALQEYQQEADRFQASMEQQLEELRSRHEEELRSQEACHSQRVESVRQQQAASVEEMRSVHQGELQELRSALKETQTSLEDRISALTAETEDLSQKLRAEEERRRQILSDKNLKDSHTVYLERELESLKVVLDLKNKQLHQKEKKLMEMEKLAEANVKLEETLTKVQQENEDYKARMDKHAALSRQLSTEQALLQQTLQKESKVNKRLSMENEELLWKLHNGDLLASPRRLSPTSPYGSPRNSASFPTAAPLSPR
ncbi:uncharacterized protein LOC101169996 isoform X3 [Oryzias latipes]